MQQDKETFEKHCATLMQRGQQGDQKAYLNLLQELTPFLRRVINKRISNTDDIEDIVQEILISLHKARPTYNIDRPFLPWLMAIMQYRLMDYLRKAYKEIDNKSSLSYNEIAQQFEDNYSDKPVTEDDIRVEYIEEVITTLPKRQQQIITLIHTEGYTSKEVAEKLGMSTSAVKVAAHRAYKKIKLIVESKESQE